MLVDILFGIALALCVVAACWFALQDNTIGLGLSLATGLAAIMMFFQPDDHGKQVAQGICLEHRAYPGCDAVIAELQRDEDKRAARAAASDQATVLDYLKGKQR